MALPAKKAGSATPGRSFNSVDLSLFANNLLDSHPQLSFEHTNPGDPRFQAVTFRPRSIGVMGVLRF
jgi:iron complex outermembrane recepter protein